MVRVGRAALLSAALLLSAAAAPSPLTPLGDGVMLLTGDSCNVVVVPGPNGLLLIDDQRIGDYDATVAALRTAYAQPVVEVINTHWHLDHAGGNAGFARAGAVIVAQRNVVTRLSVPQFMAAYNRTVPASPRVAWPTRTFADGMTIAFGRERIVLVHIDHAHTDGDTLVKLSRANVLHMGDVYFRGLFPFIDRSSGGSIQGLIRAVDAGLRLSDAGTRIVPGHGDVATRADLAAYRAMLADVAGKVRGQMAAGVPLDAIIASKPTAAYRLEGDADRFVAAIHDSYQSSSRSSSIVSK